jgi:hypothetical protein
MQGAVAASYTFYLVVVSSVFSSLQSYTGHLWKHQLQTEDNTHLLQWCPLYEV